MIRNIVVPDTIRELSKLSVAVKRQGESLVSDAERRHTYLEHIIAADARERQSLKTVVGTSVLSDFAQLLNVPGGTFCRVQDVLAACQGVIVSCRRLVQDQWADGHALL